MCGIIGIFNLNSQFVNRDLLIKMTRSLSHRGPDDEGIFISGKIGLGHRRLSIIDLSSRGHQPMSNEESSVWVTFNGEIYNHLFLRKDLEKRGHQYKSRTDTETIIHLYEEKGTDCLKYLDGEFAFSIWDANKKIVFSARDRLGIKPFYYYICDKHFIFASEIKAILLHPEVKKEVDLQAISHYLSFSVSPAPLTCFKHILKLEAGYYLIINNEGRLTKEQYWEAIPKEKLNCSESEAVEGIRLRLRDSVQERLMSDVPLGVFLSGGIDSSTNVALMSKLIKEPVKTFNVAVEGSCAYDESSYAELVSEYFNTQHHSIRLEWEDFFGFFDRLAYYADEPLCDYACVPNYYLGKLARENGVAVIQVGEGNDELFCGYRSYIAILSLLKYLQPMPGLVKGIILSALKAIRKDGLHYTLERALRNREIFLGTSYLFTEGEKEMLFKQSVKITEFDNSDNFVQRIYDSLFTKFPQADSLDKMIYLDLKLRLPELLLMRADKMTMANSVEARFPFLDYQFVEYALSLPSNFRYHDNKAKYIFKKSLEGILPKQVIVRQKKGFAGSPANILQPVFQEYILKLFKETEPLLAQWFNPDNIKKILIFSPKNTNFRKGMKIWSFFILMLWLKKFFIEG